MKTLKWIWKVVNLYSQVDGTALGATQHSLTFFIQLLDGILHEELFMIWFLCSINSATGIVLKLLHAHGQQWNRWLVAVFDCFHRLKIILLLVVCSSGYLLGLRSRHRLTFVDRIWRRFNQHWLIVHGLVRLPMVRFSGGALWQRWWWLLETLLTTCWRKLITILTDCLLFHHLQPQFVTKLFDWR